MSIHKIGEERCISKCGNLTFDTTVEHWAGRNPDAVCTVTTAANEAEHKLKKDEEPVIVIFRKYKDGGDILALFPYEDYTATGSMCMSYQHVGQHGGANYAHCLDITVNASPEEYEPLRKELEGIGYNLVIRRKRGHRR